ncbi:hypothetical protein ncot_15085 [Nocardioides sp. JQ2195]|uniref:hypothetical protein n=1 Tax=Nocardioides sp. JQ2195 TaxID=2592334 RepID=UPI00143E93A2|nr:hypothetical protein [Nocardioides sp. JQ2195]QIX27769.1 hypothetical protein ncot_15085 [Nocardioides sp. JQ2195]
MTERLSALLHDEAATLEVPAPDHVSILRKGRQARTRRRAATVVAAAAALAVVGTGAALVVDVAGDGSSGNDTATAMPSPGLISYGAGSTVVVGDTTATVPDTVHSLAYTSVGVLVRSNPNDGASDGSGPESLTLVASDGGTTGLGRIPEGVGPATDPDEPVYALAERSGVGFRAVIRDARTGDEVGSVPLPDLPMSYWDVPPLALDGDVVYAGFKKEAVAVNWRTGREEPAKGLPGGIPEVSGGHALAYDRAGISVVDVATGERLMQVPLGQDRYGFGVLSPDGRFLQFTMEESFDEKGQPREPEGIQVYDVATGDHVSLDGDPYGWGWTSSSLAVLVSGTQRTVCDPGTATCESDTGPRLGGGLRLGGKAYES